MSYRDDLDTPALVVHEEILQRNIARMAAYAASKGIALRPHFKTHKTAAVAELQKAAGATGITCAKLGEAEALADAGVYDDFFIANQIVGPHKLARLVALMERARVRVAVDTVDVAAGLNAAMESAGKTLDVVIELNTGQDRAGVKPGEEALALAETIRGELPNLRVVGVMTHEGQVNATEGVEGMTATAKAAGGDVVATAEALRERGFEISVVSVGSTPAAFATTTVAGVTEMRPGTYVFRDTSGFRYGVHGPDRCAARVVATVVSHAAPDRCIIDAGAKTLALDKGPGHPGHGYIVGHPGAIIHALSEEHGWVQIPEDDPGFTIGQRVEVIANHICPAVNLHDNLVIVRDGVVVDTWKVAARGKIT